MARVDLRTSGVIPHVHEVAAVARPARPSPRRCLAGAGDGLQRCDQVAGAVSRRSVRTPTMNKYFSVGPGLALNCN
jgi:hypothetical protein